MTLFLILTYLRSAVKFFVGGCQSHSILRNYLCLWNAAKSSEMLRMLPRVVLIWIFSYLLNFGQFSVRRMRYKHAEETPKQKPLTGLGFFFKRFAINIPSLQDWRQHKTRSTPLECGFFYKFDPYKKLAEKYVTPWEFNYHATRIVQTLVISIT